MGLNGNRQAYVTAYLDRLHGVLRSLPVDDLADALQLLEEAHVQKRQVFLAGNGGSAATASHMANDFLKGVATGDKPGLRAIGLADNVPLVTAIANDEGYENVFAHQLSALAQPGDLLVVLSGSGNSPNIVQAVETARKLGMTTIAFLGMGGGKAAKMAEVSIIVPSDDYGPIEATHLIFDHLITAYLHSWLEKGHGTGGAVT